MPPTQLVHELAPAAGLIVPGAHGVWTVDPVAHEDPFSQAVQSDAAARPNVLEYVPATHGSSADAPRGQKLPIPHTLQAVDPEPSWKLPASHCAHSA